MGQAADVFVGVDRIGRGSRDDRRCRIEGWVAEATVGVEGRVCGGDDWWRHVVCRGVAGRRVAPRVDGAEEGAIKLCSLASMEDDGLGAVHDEEFNCEFVEVWADGGEAGLEFGEPAAECFAAAIPMLIGMVSGRRRRDGRSGGHGGERGVGRGRRSGRLRAGEIRYHVSVQCRVRVSVVRGTHVERGASGSVRREFSVQVFAFLFEQSSRTKFGNKGRTKDKRRMSEGKTQVSYFVRLCDFFSVRRWNRSVRRRSEGETARSDTPPSDEQG